MPLTTNRTKWPTTGGALSFQPGWQTGHKTALIYINMGLGTVPRNYSMIMLPVFQIILPSNEQDQGASVCLPQVPLPVGLSVRAGDNATIQLVESAQHGAGLYNVSFPCIPEMVWRGRRLGLCVCACVRMNAMRCNAMRCHAMPRAMYTSKTNQQPVCLGI